jgi:hypothetical protein
MIAQDRDHRNSHGGANIGDKCLCFVGKPVFGEIAAKQQYISAAGNLGKRFVQHTARMFAVRTSAVAAIRSTRLAIFLEKRNGLTKWTFLRAMRTLAGSIA